MPIDPRIALGYQAPQFESPVNMMMMAQKLQSGQQENQLRQAQMENYQAEAARRNALLPYEQDKLIREAKAAEVTGLKTESDLLDSKLKQSRSFLDTIDPNDPNAPSAFLTWHQANHNDPIIGPALQARGVTVDSARAQIDAALAQPGGFAKLLAQSKLGAEKFAENTRLEAVNAETSLHNRRTESTAAAAAQAAKAPTVTTIRDPNDPNRNLQIDARTYRGGTVGDTGVLGESSKPTETAKLDARELAKREAAYPQATTSVKSVEGNTDALITKLKTLRDHPGLSGMTGLIAGRTWNITGPAREAQALYKQIMATGQFGVLQALRESSKTGGALGNVSDTEGKALRDSFGALDQTQDTPSFQKGIDAAITDLERTKRTVREGYDTTYEYKSGGNGRAAPAAPAAAASGWGEAKVK